MTIHITEGCTDWDATFQYKFPDRELPNDIQETVRGVIHIVGDAVAVLLNPVFSDEVRDVLAGQYRAIAELARESFMDTLDEAQYHQICVTSPAGDFDHANLYGFDLRTALEGILTEREAELLEHINKPPTFNPPDFDEDDRDKDYE